MQIKTILNHQIAQEHKIKPTSHPYSISINYDFDKYGYFTLGRVMLNGNFCILFKKEMSV